MSKQSKTVTSPSKSIGALQSRYVLSSTEGIISVSTGFASLACQLFCLSHNCINFSFRFALCLWVHPVIDIFQRQGHICLLCPSIDQRKNVTNCPSVVILVGIFQDAADHLIVVHFVDCQRKTLKTELHSQSPDTRDHTLLLCIIPSRKFRVFVECRAF